MVLAELAGRIRKNLEAVAQFLHLPAPAPDLHLRRPPARLPVLSRVGAR
jgi:hypothetical protein